MMDFSLITDEPLDYCVYAHVNKQNGKMYIGVTCRLEHRWSANGYYYQLSTKFYRAIQKYGWDNFEHIVLIDGISESMAYIYEKELINKYNTQSNGYNILPGGKTFGTTGKKVYQYDLDGYYIQEWENGIIASRETGTNHNSICRCAREDSQCLSSGGYQWRYYKTDKIPPYLGKRQKINNDAILQFSLDGILLKKHNENDDLIDESKKKHIYNACNTSHYAYQYLWFWESDYSEEAINYVVNNKGTHVYSNKDGHIAKKVYRYSLDGNLLDIYKSVKEAAKLTNISYNNIYGACYRSEKRHYCNGYLWYHYEDCNGQEKIQPFDGVKNKTKLFQYSFDGIFIKEYDSITQANSEHKGLKSALKRGKNIHHNYLWFKEFKGDFVDTGGEINGSCT